METMCDGDVVIIQKGTFYKKCRLMKNRPYSFGKKGEGQFTLNLDNAVGHSFGSTFKMIREKHKIFHLEKIVKPMETIEIEAESGTDNRNLIDDGQSQKLSKEDIVQLMNSGATGQEVIQTLTENSSTFHAKTKYSQEKWMNKKQKKYDELVTLYRPTVRLLVKMNYTQDPLKIANLRVDSLSQILSYSNVQPGGKYAIFEAGTLGLITAAMLQRMGDQGHLVHIYQGNMPQRESVDSMNFSHNEMMILSFISINKLGDLGKDNNEIEDSSKPEEMESNTEENHTTDVVETSNSLDSDKTTENTATKRKFKYVRKRDDDIAVSSKTLKSGVSGLVVACRQHSTALTLHLFKYLISGHPFVVFSPYKEVLVDMYDELQTAGGVNMRLCESWLRYYQILPMRTHPQINMSGGGGYILYGYKVDK